MKTILIDLDGVLNTYTGEFNQEYIPPIREGAKEFLENLKKEGYEIKIFTTRKKELAQKWVQEMGINNLIEYVTNYKEPCFLMIDDRCIKFEGNYEITLEQINKFTPWHKV